jgi:hypothetical protein
MLQPLWPRRLAQRSGAAGRGSRFIESCESDASGSCFGHWVLRAQKIRFNIHADQQCFFQEAEMPQIKLGTNGDAKGRFRR